MVKNSKEYWEGRAEALSSPIWRKTEKVNKELEKIYRQSAKEIQQELGEWLSKYQANHELDAESMKRIMNTKEAAEFRYTVKGYIEKIKELGDSKEAEALLEEFNIMAGKVRYQRYEELQAQMQYQALKLAQSTQGAIQEHLEKIIPDVYTRSIFDVQQTLGIGFSFNQINPATIESIISTPWNIKNFSESIWDNRKVMIQNLRRIIVGGVMQGQEFKRMSQALQKEMGTSFYRARRVLETETTYALEKAKTESYKELGIDEYMFIATLDSRTSEACQRMDGKKFRLKDEMIGVNSPPLHPFCRSTRAPAVDLEGATRFARGEDGQTYKVPADMTYEEWLKEYGNGGIIENKKEVEKKEEKPTKIELDKLSENSVIKQCLASQIEYRAIEKYNSIPSEEMIISQLGGGDRTKGSCSSLAFAYSGNKGGYNVLDFRGGDSCSLFSRNKTIIEISELQGVKSWVIREKNDFVAIKKLLTNMEDKKEYYLAIGKHAAIIRKNENTYEYLELQSAKTNGFKKLETNVLKNRFGCQKSYSIQGSKFSPPSMLIDVETLKENKDFQQILGFINTREREQIKGVGGSEK